MKSLSLQTLFVFSAFYSLAQAQDQCAENLSLPETRVSRSVQGASDHGPTANAGSDVDRSNGSDSIDYGSRSSSSQGGGFYEGSSGGSHSTDF